MNPLGKSGFTATIFFLFLATIATNAFAQDQKFRVGLIAGLELSNGILEVKSSDTIMSGKFHDPKAGFKLGVIGEYSFNEYFALTPGVVFKQRGAKGELSLSDGWSSYAVKSSTNINYLQIPINAKVSVPINRDFKVFGVAGPYVAFGLSGKETDELKSNGVNVGKITFDLFSGDVSSGNLFLDDVLEDYSKYSKLKRSDFGLTFGGGMEYKKIFVSIQYDLGLSNLYKAPEINGVLKTSNRNLGISVGYMFN